MHCALGERIMEALRDRARKLYVTYSYTCAYDYALCFAEIYRARKLYVTYSYTCAYDYALYFAEIYSSIERAASLPAPIAEITVAAPVTASPPA